MKKQIADRWIKELRSGDWQQGTGYLDRDGKQCCLGVLSLMAMCEGVVEADLRGHPLGQLYTSFGSSGDGGALSPEVCKWSGMKTGMGRYKSGPSLASLNDSGTPFTGIADVIEKNWENL